MRRNYRYVPIRRPVRGGGVARLTRELKEALERQAATSEVLEVIRQSAGDLEPVFATILGKQPAFATPNSEDVSLGRRRTSPHGTHNAPPAFAETDQGKAPFHPAPDRHA